MEVCSDEQTGPLVRWISDGVLMEPFEEDGSRYQIRPARSVLIVTSTAKHFLSQAQ